MGSNHIQDTLTLLAKRQDLPEAEAEHAFQIILSGGATPAQIGAFLMGLRQKGETATELASGARVMRAKMKRFEAPDGAIDCCGTGGDGQRTLNISTATALVIAACGVPVIKHGNRAVTSASGSSDVLQALGLPMEITPEKSLAALTAANITFLFAPLYHPSLRHVGPVRTELGLRTIFNLLGPLCNPAGVTRQVIGVYHSEWIDRIAETLLELGSEHAWIVAGDDGMDELTTTGETHVAALEQGKIRRFTVTPEEAGLPRATLDDLRGGDAETNARALTELLGGKKGPYRDIVLLNSAAGLIVAEKASSLREGVALAAEALEGAVAQRTLATLLQAVQ